MPAEKEARVGLEVPDGVRNWFSQGRAENLVPPLAVREWLGKVLQQNYRLFFSIAYGFFANSSSAEDVVQTAALRSMQKIGQLKQPELVVAWFASITRNTCLDLLRNRMQNSLAPLEAASSVPSRMTFDPTRLDQQRLLLAAIGDLPENQGLVVCLRFIEECDISEIAQMLGLKENAVEVRLHRALKSLRKHSSLKVLEEAYR